MIQIIPAILPESFDDLAARVKRVVGLVPLVQIDVADGSYAKSCTWPFINDRGIFPKLVKGEEGMPDWKEVSYEVDFLIQKPSAHLTDWIAAGASGFVFHLESMHPEELKACIEEVRNANARVGIAIRPSTSVDVLNSFGKEADFIQLMGNDTIGYHAQSLDERIYDKLRILREMYPGCVLGVDIGVTRETAPKLVAAGARRLVSGSTIFDVEDPMEVIEEWQELDNEKSREAV